MLMAPVARHRPKLTISGRIHRAPDTAPPYKSAGVYLIIRGFDYFEHLLNDDIDVMSFEMGRNEIARADSGTDCLPDRVMGALRVHFYPPWAKRRGDGISPML